MWQWLVETLRTYPEIAIFLTLGLGFWVGKFKVGTFSLGVVTSTLLAGVLVGPARASPSPSHVKSMFFLMFLFAVGYGVGPQFFRGLEGRRHPAGAVRGDPVRVRCWSRRWSSRKFLGYDAGGAAGLLAGSQHDLRRARRRHQQHRPARHRRCREEGDARCHAGGLCGDLPVRHRGLRVDPGEPRAEDPSRGHRGRVPEVRGGDGRHAGLQQRPAVGLHPVRAARLPADRSGLGRPHGARLRGQLRRHRPGSTRSRLFVERLRQDGQIIEPKPDTAAGPGRRHGDRGPPRVGPGGRRPARRRGRRSRTARPGTR